MFADDDLPDPTERDLPDPGEPPPRPNYWAEEAAKGDVEPRRCIHGVPLNVFCGRCES
jgi:hypothetical protein